MERSDPSELHASSRDELGVSDPGAPPPLAGDASMTPTERAVLSAPKRGPSWPILLIVALALLLPVGVFFAIPGSSGEAQFDALFSESSVERAQALDYWSTTFRGSEPRLFRSTIVEERLNERMRTAESEVVLDFHRHFQQDPGYLAEFRPTMLRALTELLERDGSAEMRRGVVAQALTLVRQERVDLDSTGPTLTAGDHDRLRGLIDAAAASLIAEPGESARAEAADLVGLAAQLSWADAQRVAEELASEGGGAIGEAARESVDAIDPPGGLPAAPLSG